MPSHVSSVISTEKVERRSVVKNCACVCLKFSYMMKTWVDPGDEAINVITARTYNFEMAFSLLTTDMSSFHPPWPSCIRFHTSGSSNTLILSPAANSESLGGSYGAPEETGSVSYCTGISHPNLNTPYPSRFADFTPYFVYYSPISTASGPLLHCYPRYNGSV